MGSGTKVQVTMRLDIDTVQRLRAAPKRLKSCKPPLSSPGTGQSQPMLCSHPAVSQ